MNIKKVISTSCVVRTDLVTSRDLAECKLDSAKCAEVESATKLVDMDFSQEDVETLGKLEHVMPQGKEELNTALGDISNQLDEITLEIEMLSLRKNALKKRSRVLGKLRDIDDIETER